jgi:two-component system, cell cycle sensor histidine kinase and response regulator CckA
MPEQDLNDLEYREVFESSPGNYLLLSPDLTIVGVTDAYLRTTMTRRDDILGRGLFDVFPDNPNDPNASGVRNLKASLRRVLEYKLPDRMALQKYDIRRPESEGDGFEERYWSPLNTPVLDPSNEVRYIIHWVEDVTAFIRLRQEMERDQAVSGEALTSGASHMKADAFLQREAVETTRKLTESERRYRFLADAVPQLIWTADPAGKLDYVNARWIAFTGLARDQLLGEGWQSVVHPEDRERIAIAWAEAVARKTERFQEEHRLRHHDGVWHFVLTTAVPYPDGNREIAKWFGTTTDIHDRVMAEEQVRQAQRLHAVGKLAGGMAHEVNNMMSAVLGFGELVLGGMMPDDPNRRDVEEMVKAGKRAAEVTRQLLAFSRQQVLKPVVMDLNDVVGDLVPALERLLSADRRLEVVGSRRAVLVRADRGQVEQVLINLVSNARDATPASGMVMIKIDTTMVDEGLLARHLESELPTGRYARITVTDNGMGMSPEVAARAFEPFFTTKVVGRGTGLGLSMVYGIVKQSGGFLGMESTPDQGTSFTVHLPLVDAEITQPIMSPMAPQGRGETILVVEDEQVVRSLVLRILEAYGYRVYQAPTGIAALEFLSKPGTEVDLVVSDIVMPRMSGRELGAKLKEKFPGLPILYMSGYSGTEIKQQGLIEEGAAFIQKPITPDALAIAVRSELDRMERAHRLR